METAEDVSGVLGLCAVLVKDQKELGSMPQQSGPSSAHQGPGRVQRTSTQSQVNSTGQDLAEEQGWLARMVHLFRSDDLATQFEVGCRSCCTVMLVTSADKCHKPWSSSYRSPEKSLQKGAKEFVTLFRPSSHRASNWPDVIRSGKAR